ncbi:MAG: type II toxin-antitoxin system VapB family antitoxin, partial [Bryobacteraceae bacterium]
MALNIKNIEVERLADEVARLTKETKTEAIRRALVERKARLKIRPAERSRMERLEI